MTALRKIWRDLPLRLSQNSHSDACSCSAHFPLSGGRGPPEKSAERPCRIFWFPDIYHKTEQNSRRVTGRMDPERIRLYLDKGLLMVIGHRMLWFGSWIDSWRRVSDYGGKRKGPRKEEKRQ